MMSASTNRGNQNKTLRYVVAILCVLLILFVGVAQVLHTHAADEAANASCSLCAVAHVSVLAVPVQANPVLVEAVVPVAKADPVSAPQRFFSSDLYVRPPPAATNLS